MDDILIRGGEVIDGIGAAGRIADVSVRDGTIIGIGKGGEAWRIIEARGHVVAPGFIDIPDGTRLWQDRGSAEA